MALPSPLRTGAIPVLQVQGSALQQFSFALLVAFLFMLFSRIFDVRFYWLHLPGISYRVMGIFLVITGAFLTAIQDIIGKFVLAFTLWILLGIPFSVWRTGSLQMFTGEWLVCLVVFLATASLVSDWRQYRRTVTTIAFAILVLTVISLSLGTMQNGRLFLARGRFSNPNEMAQALLLGMPFWWAAYSNARFLPGKLLAAGSLALMAYVIGETGSRGALAAILVAGGLMFLRASLQGKIKVIIGAAAILLLAAVILPGSLRTRYHTFFSVETEQAADDPNADDADLTGSAAASANVRKELFVRSLLETVRHPLLGVGPGMFAVAEDSFAKSQGKRKGAWLGTHNTFTQVSSECGIPGLLFYGAIVVLSLRKSYSLYRRTMPFPELQQIHTQALALNYALIIFAMTGMFVHAAYTSLLPVLAGLTVSLVRTAEPELAAATVRASQGPVLSRNAF